MIKSTLIFFLISLYAWNTNAQDTDVLNQEASPKNGINDLAVKFYGIDFTREQRKELKDKEIEFIFQIDELGKVTLSEVNGTHHVNIIDSLKTRTNKLNNFNPKIVNGIPKPSIYFMQLVFPNYKLTKQRIGIIQSLTYSEADLEDFEYIQKTGEKIDMVFGGMMNNFYETPSEYLGLGGGMKMEVSYTDKKQFIYGLGMSVYGNNKKKKYPIITSNELFSTPTTVLLGIVFGKWMKKINFQAEINYAVQNISKDVSENLKVIQLTGWSPGFVVNYPIRIGKEKTTYYYGEPSLFGSHLNFHFGLRYLSLSLSEASGIMTEIGISYRMSIHKVNKYKVRQL